jgi:hypothetical protein
VGAVGAGTEICACGGFEKLLTALLVVFLISVAKSDAFCGISLNILYKLLPKLLVVSLIFFGIVLNPLEEDEEEYAIYINNNIIIIINLKLICLSW